MNFSQIINEQEKKLQKYEVKLRDLVAAYKSLQTEKELLETTLKSLSCNQDDYLEDNVDEELNQLRSQVSTLSSTISTLTEEKRKVERKFIEDKKVNRAEYETSLARISAELTSREDGNSQFDAEKEANYRLRQQCDNLRRELEDKERSEREQQRAHENRVTQLEESIANTSESMGQLQHHNIVSTETVCRLQERVRQLTATRTSVPPSAASAQTTSSGTTGRLSNDATDDTPDILQCSADPIPMDPNARKELLTRKLMRIWQHLSELDPELDAATLLGDSQEPEPSPKPTVPEPPVTVAPDHLNQLLAAKSNIAELRQDLKETEIAATTNQKSLRDTILKNEWSHKHELQRLRQEHDHAMVELQTELTLHRNRTLDLLKDKEDQLSSLRLQLTSSSDTPVPSSPCRNSQGRGAVKEGSASPGDIAKLMDNSCPLYQCCETKARMELELRRVRHQKRQLEMTVHRLEAEMEYERTESRGQLDGLRAELDSTHARYKQQQQMAQKKQQKIECSATDPSGALSAVDLEYLRNVYLRLLLSADSSCRQLMLKAIGHVLQFSTDEVTRALARSSSWL